MKKDPNFVDLKTHTTAMQAITGMRSAPTDIIGEHFGIIEDAALPAGPQGIIPFGPALSFDPENYGTVSIWPRDDEGRHLFSSPTGPETIEITSTGRIIHAEKGAAVLRPVKTSPPVPEIGPLATLLAATALIPTQPTTEQWQTVKQAILDLARS